MLLVLLLCSLYSHYESQQWESEKEEREPRRRRWTESLLTVSRSSHSLRSFLVKRNLVKRARSTTLYALSFPVLFPLS